MPATYPGGIKSFTTINNNDTSDSSQIDSIYDEVTALETALINGFQHNISPLNDNSKDLGDATHAWKNLWTKGTTQFNGIAYTWPAADGAASQVLQTNGSKVFSWGHAVDNHVFDFRLTLTTATPVTTADVTAATTLYCSPYAGNRIALYDGSLQWNIRTSAEFSIAVPSTTSQMYDVFVYDNAGVPTLELLAWTNDTTRATALVLQDGVLVKSGATTRRYVGSFRTTTVSGQTEDSATKRYLWNYYNRVSRMLSRAESTATWNYTTATYRQANAATANQVEVVIGFGEVLLDLAVFGLALNTNTGVIVQVSIGEDSTTAPVAGVYGMRADMGVVNTVFQLQAILRRYPAIGRHFYAWLEKSAATGTTTWVGTNGDSTSQLAGIFGSILG